MSGAGRKTPSQCKMRWERILNPGVKRGLWTKEEDQKLKEVAAAMDYKWSHVSCQCQAFSGMYCWVVFMCGAMSWVGGVSLSLGVCGRPVVVVLCCSVV